MGKDFDLATEAEIKGEFWLPYFDLLAEAKRKEEIPKVTTPIAYSNSNNVMTLQIYQETKERTVRL